MNHRYRSWSSAAAFSILALSLCAGCPDMTTGDPITGDQTNGDPNTGDPTTGDPATGGGGLTADLSAGETLYTNSCAACHALGTFDADGFASDLSGRSSAVVTDLSTINGAMANLTLTDQEIVDVGAFLDAN